MSPTTLGILDRVTPETTLADIGVLCARYGVYKYDVTITPQDKVTTIVVLTCKLCVSIGKGQTLPEAFDDAFARIMHRTGALLSEAENAPAK